MRFGDRQPSHVAWSMQLWRRNASFCCCFKGLWNKRTWRSTRIIIAINHSLLFLTTLPVYIYIWVRVKIQGMDQSPGPTRDPYPPIHTLIHILWYCMIHTLDPYPWSIPLILSRWRKTDAGPNAAFYPNTAFGPRTATPVATTAASAASVLLLLPLLVIFLPGAAATAVASAAAPAGPAPAAGAGSLPPCASGSWTNATSWLATSNITSAPWRLVRLVLVLLVALWLQPLLFLLCLARVELD